MKEIKLETIPWNCPACKTCRLITKGTYGCAGPRQCIVGGPYKGYLDLTEATYKPLLDPDNVSH
jgi:hypothetical protein